MLIVRKRQIKINTKNIFYSLSLMVGITTLDKLLYSLHKNIYKYNLMAS